MDEVAARSGTRDAARRKSAPPAYELRPEGEAALAEELDRLSRTV